MNLEEELESDGSTEDADENMDEGNRSWRDINSMDRLVFKSCLSFLTIWAIQHNIKFRAIDDLLNILNNHGVRCPKTARTLCNTNKLPPNIIEKPQVLYYCFDWIKTLTKNMYFMLLNMLN